jgi:penicillin-binding protein 1A
VRARAAVRKVRASRLGSVHWKRGLVRLLVCSAAFACLLTAAGLYYFYFDRNDLPDLGGFTRFEFPTIGYIYDANGRPLKEMASEARQITRYEDIPPIVRDAIVAAEDKNFFSHSGIDCRSFARVLGKIRLGDLMGRLARMGKRNVANNAAIFPQGGSTITQQLVRGYFLRTMTAQENSDQLRHSGRLPRMLSSVIGARTVNMLVRKAEEIRLSLWIEEKMRKQFGSKRLAKQEILARYASLIYMGNGQYGIARGADYYFGRSLDQFTAEDADKAALLAGTAKSARYFAPSASDTRRVVQRRNQTLALMAANGFLSPVQLRRAQGRPIEVLTQHRAVAIEVSAVVDNVLDELTSRRPDLSARDLLRGRIQVYSTVDARVQQIANEALEHGLALYEKRRPGARGVVQGSVVILRNRDASILGETGGRQFYKHRVSAYADFNRVTKSLRQPGSAMKPFVYLAAFREGTFNLDTVAPDEAIGVPDGREQDVKWISNYDGQYKGMIPLRTALAESRNTVAIWITEQIGVDRVIETAHSLGIQTPLRSFATTSLGASEVTLLELANSYRALASGILIQPYIIRKIVRDSNETVFVGRGETSPVHFDDEALSFVQEGMRGVVRLPGGTAHALDSRGFPIAVMGKTGTTNEFRDALFVGSTYGPEGITVAVRIGFDDNRSLGGNETGGRVALPVFKEVMSRVYGEKVLGRAPSFPAEMERHIDRFLHNDATETDTAKLIAPTDKQRNDFATAHASAPLTVSFSLSSFLQFYRKPAGR